MRDAAFACIRRIGVETGGSNIQFAVEPDERRHGRHRDEPARVAVERAREQGDRVPDRQDRGASSRSATGSTRSRNDITGETPASFEPTIDYVVTKVPRWAFEKLPGASPVLGTQMQSVGEVMAIGRTFPESLQKALRSLETGRARASTAIRPSASYDGARRRRARARGRGRRRPSGSFQVEAALRRGVSVERLHEATGIDPWFLDQILADRRGARRGSPSVGLDDDDAAPTGGGPSGSGSPTRSSRTSGASTEDDGPRGAPRRRRATSPTRPSTPARPSSRRARRTTTAPTRTKTRSRRSTKPAVVILGSGPNRIGQGVEFDYCCVHAAFALSRRRLRDGDGQLQPRDRLHRLRHQRPALLRAAHREDVLNVCDALQDARPVAASSRA